MIHQWMHIIWKSDDDQKKSEPKEKLKCNSDHWMEWIIIFDSSSDDTKNKYIFTFYIVVDYCTRQTDSHVVDREPFCIYCVYMVMEQHIIRHTHSTVIADDDDKQNLK